MDTLRVLVVDDSVLYRKILSDALNSFDQVEVVGTAHSGKAALAKLKMTSVDFITLDFEMPEMDGVEVLKQLKENHNTVEAIMISAHTLNGAAVTMQALAAGAFDFITKPGNTSMQENQSELEKQLRHIINMLLTRKRLRSPGKKVTPPPTLERKTDLTAISSRMKQVAKVQRVEAVGIAISTGGPNALAEVIPKLPGNIRVPIFIVQHMPPVFTKALADTLNKKSKLNVIEASDGIAVVAGTVYIAPGGKQMKIITGENGKILQITDDPPENNCKPAADFTFRSLAKEYRAGALGVIMTGMGSDGVRGLIIMKKFGSKVIAQDQASCVVYGMPMEAVKANVVDIQLPLNQIAEEIVNSIR